MFVDFEKYRNKRQILWLNRKENGYYLQLRRVLGYFEDKVGV